MHAADTRLPTPGCGIVQGRARNDRSTGNVRHTLTHALHANCININAAGRNASDSDGTLRDREGGSIIALRTMRSVPADDDVTNALAYTCTESRSTAIGCTAECVGCREPESRRFEPGEDTIVFARHQDGMMEKIHMIPSVYTIEAAEAAVVGETNTPKIQRRVDCTPAATKLRP